MFDWLCFVLDSAVEDPLKNLPMTESWQGQTKLAVTAFKPRKQTNSVKVAADAFGRSKADLLKVKCAFVINLRVHFHTCVTARARV